MRKLNDINLTNLDTVDFSFDARNAFSSNDDLDWGNSVGLGYDDFADVDSITIPELTVETINLSAAPMDTASAGFSLDKIVETSGYHTPSVTELLTKKDDDLLGLDDGTLGCCGCSGCANLADSSADMMDGGGAGVEAPGSFGTLQTLANFLTTGYWSTPRRFNIDDNGTGANFGTLYYNISGFSQDGNGLTAARKTMAREAFDVFEEVLGINFVETTSTAGHVDIFFKDNDLGVAYASSVLHAGTNFVDYSVINVASNWYGGLSNIGGTQNYTFQTFIHEIGHSLGLGHQGPYNGSGVTYAGDAIYKNDSWQQSIMSYFSQTQNTDITASYAQVVTPMAVDWLALDNLYSPQDYAGNNFGVSNAFNGNTVYGVGTNVSSGIQAYYGLAGFADTNGFTIVDGSGIDTVNFSNYSANQTINLAVASAGSTVGSLSSVGGKTGNMAIAVGTVIENATSGSGNDYLYGNSSVNILQGNAGVDRLYGYGGNDGLYGGDDTDYLYGGSGNDTLVGGNGNDFLYGSTGADNLYGGNGNDYLYGSSSADTLYGGNNNDYLYGGTSVDAVYGGAGNDRAYVLAGEFLDDFYGGSGIDTYDMDAITNAAHSVVINMPAGTVTGYGGTQTLQDVENVIATQANDTIYSDGSGSFDADAGNDVVYAGLGSSEILNGGTGTDWLYTTTFNGTYVINMATGVTNYVGESFINFENIYTGSGNDTITGTSGNNIIWVNNGNDTVHSSGGTDTVYGGGGNDVLYSSGAGSYYGGSGDDTVYAGNGTPETLDGGTGTDLLVTTSFTGNYTVNLATGATNYTGESFTNFENLITGSGSDTITGTGGANIISTNAGNDIINAGAGNDIINGGAGNDTINGGSGVDVMNGDAGNDTFIINAGWTGGPGEEMNGGSGIDTFDYSSISSNGTVNLGLGTFTYTPGGSGTIALSQIENVIGGSGNDTFIGSAAANVMIGNAGVESVFANGGNDTVYGGDGNDTLRGGIGDDVLFGGDGNDNLQGNNQQDTLHGGNGADTLTGGGGNDGLYGGNGNDFMVGNSGQDVLYGGANDDDLSGNAGGDDLHGGSGADRLHGGGGNDNMWGDGGADIFEFTNGFRVDRIKDFEDGIDRIDVSGHSSWNNFADILADASQAGANVIIQVNPNNRMVIENFDLADLDVGDFIF